jgi:hypothetical protein
MINLLPKVNEKVRKVEESKVSYWNRDDADPEKATISGCLQKEFTIPVEYLIKYKENVLPKPPPNYVSPLTLARLPPSMISEGERGIPDDVEISTRPFIAEKEKNLEKDTLLKSKPMEKKSSASFIKIFNNFRSSLDLFLQYQQVKFINRSIRPFSSYHRLLDANITSSVPSLKRNFSIDDPSVSPYDIFQIFLSNIQRSTITTTTRQEIKDYRFFTNQKIGLEVELVNGRVRINNNVGSVF